MSFPYFINKAAPVSAVQSLMDYDVTLTGEICHGRIESTIKVVVPVTSLCPCSKEISERGAHNQRSHVTVTVSINEHLWIEELVQFVEAEASCELYGLLKRPDEKFVTERAYDNPKFVEDMVRDVAARLNAERRIDTYVVESENFESIHNHSAYALIENDKRSSKRHLNLLPVRRSGRSLPTPPASCPSQQRWCSALLADQFFLDPRRLA
jgi:GTP cyclohydrolase I